MTSSADDVHVNVADIPPNGRDEPARIQAQPRHQAGRDRGVRRAGPALLVRLGELQHGQDIHKAWRRKKSKKSCKIHRVTFFRLKEKILVLLKASIHCSF